MTTTRPPGLLAVEEVNDAGELSAYREEWEQLVARSPAAELFETYQWITSWLAAYWRDRPIAFLFVRDGEECVGLVPLLDDQDGSIGCKHSLVTPVNPHARRCNILHADRPAEVLDSTLAHLRETRRGSRLRIRCGDAGSPMIEALRERPDHTLVRTKEAGPIIRIEGDWTEYLSSRPRHLRRELTRKRRKLESSWEVKWTTIIDRDQHERALTEVLHIERESWKSREGTSMDTEPNAAGFYARLARNLAAEGMLRIELLSLDSHPVAHIFGAVFNNTYFALKTSYDEIYRSWSPGVVLFQYVIERAFQDGLSTFDFLGFESRWKTELANDVLTHADACAFAGDAYKCRWDVTRQTRLKPFVRKHAPALPALKAKLDRRLGRD